MKRLMSRKILMSILEFGRKRASFASRYYPGIRLERYSNIAKNFLIASNKTDKFILLHQRSISNIQ